MDRDKEQINRRIAASLQDEPRTRRLGRRDFKKGGPGYLYAQACAFLSALHTLPSETSASSLSDFEYREPRNFSVEAPKVDAPRHVSMTVPTIHRKPPDDVLMARMGATMVAGMVVAFACELAMKAILLTRLDQAEKTHDLLDLYKALPEDSRKRVEGDFEEVAEILKENRQAFGNWRYFEQDKVNAFLALVDTDRVWRLGKAARVLVDECIVAGLQYEIEFQQNTEFTGEVGDMKTSTIIHLRVSGDEAAIPWDAILTSSPDKHD